MSSLRDSQYYDLDEVAVEMVPAEDRYPDLDDTATEATETLFMDNSEADDFEIPRGALRLSMPLDEHFPSPVVLERETELEDQDSKKTRMFMDAIRGDGNWARSLNQVKLSFSRNSYLKDNITDVFTHFITRVNNRPKTTILTTKCVDLEAIQDLIQLAFDKDDEEMARNHSMFRIHCKNVTKTLGSLVQALSPLCKRLELRLSVNDIFAELKTSSTSSIRYKTKNIADYFPLEEHAQQMRLRVQTTLSIRKRANPSREVLISWYDQYKEGPGGGHVTYIYFDHNAFRQTESRVTFGEVTISSTFEVPTEKMVPLSVLQPVKDLIDFLHRTSVGSNSM